MPTQGVRILIATRPVDFRKGHDGLAALVQNMLREAPFTGTVFLFRSKRADRLKLLFSGEPWSRHRCERPWRKTELVMAYKRLEASSFVLPPLREGVMTFNRARIKALFAGLDWRKVRPLEVKAPARAK